MKKEKLLKGEQEYRSTMSDEQLLAASWLRLPPNHKCWSGRVKLHKNERGFSVEMDCQFLKSGTYCYDIRPVDSLKKFREVMEASK